MLKLHGFCASNYVNMVKFVLLEKEADFQFITRYPDQEPDTLAISPMGKMPVLETEHGMLTETQAILWYLDWAVDGPILYPLHPFERAHVQRLMHMIELYVELPARSCYPEAFFGGQVSDETKERAREALVKGAQALARVATFNPYLAGEDLTVADALFLYSFDLAATTASKLFDLDLFKEAPGALELHGRLSERPSAKQIAADRDASMADFFAYVRGHH